MDVYDNGTPLVSCTLYLLLFRTSVKNIFEQNSEDVTQSSSRTLLHRFGLGVVWRYIVCGQIVLAIDELASNV